MTEHEPTHDEAEYWNADEAIGEVTLWRDQRYSLRLKAHVAEELYRQPVGDEIIPLKQPRGVRSYVNAKPYILLPNVTLGADLYPQPAPSGAAGEVTSSTWEGMRHEEIGQCQAYYYPEDQAIILWEAYFLDRFRNDSPVNDPNTYALWEGFEQFLRNRFPSVRLIATTHDDPLYQQEDYQQFLASMGYRQVNDAAFGKDIPA